MHIAGARPNFPKLAPVYRAMRTAAWRQTIVHTGQHYDAELSERFFVDLEIPPPELNLEVGSASHAVQTARIMERLEGPVADLRPDWVLVYGDVNSTVAAALVAAKLGVRLAHVEAGLRSHDRTMPEEVNRIVTDRLANLLLTPSRDADRALLAEGEPLDEIAFVGNVMIDTLFHVLPRARESRFAEGLGLAPGAVVVTLHRPSNVDDRDRFSSIASALSEIARERPVVFPMHPRTRQRVEEFNLSFGSTRVLDSVGYLQLLDLVRRAGAVVTDSGGLQEETTVLGIPCFTLRANTERPVTISEGTNELVPDPAVLGARLRSRPASGATPRRPEGWDGHAAERVVAAIRERS